MSRFFSSSWTSSREKYFFADDDDDPFMETRPLISTKGPASSPRGPQEDTPAKPFQKWQPMHLSRALHGLGAIKSRLGPSLERCCLLSQALNVCAKPKPPHDHASVHERAGVGFALYVATATPLAATFFASWVLRQVLLYACGVKREDVLWFCHFMVILFAVAALHYRLRRKWGALLQEGGSLSSRSLLVSSTALRGIESLVPTAKEVAGFFKASFNAEPENILIILEVGDRLKQRRLNGKPADVSCCRVLPEFTKLVRLAKKQYSTVDLVDPESEELRREVESSGCVIVTFESAQVVQRIMSTTNLSKFSSRRCCGASGDHALRWWSMPPLQFPVALGDSENRVFMRIAPEPSDINYEAFVPLRPKSSVSLVSMALLCLLALANAACATLILFLCHHVKGDVLRALLPGCTSAFQVSFMCSWATKRQCLKLSSLHSTFTSLQRSWYVCGVVLAVASVLPVVLTSAESMLTFERYGGAVCLLLVEMWVLAYRLRKGFPTCTEPTSMIALGRVYAEKGFIVLATCAVAQRLPIALLLAAIFLRCDAALVCRDLSAMGSKQKFGPELTFSMLRVVPIAAGLPLLLSTLIKPQVLGIWLSSAAGVLALLWTGASTSSCYSAPRFLPKTMLKPQATSSETETESQTDDDLVKSGTSIAFRSDSSEQWEDQMHDGERDSENYYVLPAW